MVTFNASVSGMNAAWTQMGVAANNIANLNTDGYRAQNVNFVSTPDGGVRAASAPSSPGDAAPNGSNVDPAVEMERAQTGSMYFQANAKVVQTQDQMVGTLLDTRG